MFSVAPLHPLHNGVLELVARHPEITMSELHERLRKTYKLKTSLQHLYRVVTQMEEEQVLVKMKGKVSLNLMWASYLSFYAERARRAAAQSVAAHANIPLKDGERRKYVAASLQEVEAIWNHLLVQLYHAVGGQTLHKYYSHAWWLLGKQAHDVGFYRELSSRGIRCQWLFGNDTPLDRAGAQKLKQIFTTVITDMPGFPKEGYNLNVYGDYVLECILPDKLAADLGAFFRGTASPDEFDADAFLDLCVRRTPCTVTVWRNAAQAQALRDKIAPLTA